MPIPEGGTFTPHNRIVSPGVFTRVFDQSGIAQGVQDIGGVVVAPFPKGPGFSPTLVRDVATLEDKFGVADGTYYGPYTAKEYLLERGVVTVCRVGALTGYHQKYPFVLYAIKGTYGRNVDSGSLAVSSSVFSLSDSIVASSSAHLDLLSTGVRLIPSAYTNSASNAHVTASVQFKGVPFTPTFVDTVGTATAATGTGASGSLLYYGQSVSGFYVNATTTASIYFTVPFASLSGSTATTSSLMKYLLTNSAFSASIGNVSAANVVSGSDPFDSVTLLGAGVQAISGACATYIYGITGMIAGEIGYYDGTFNSDGTPTFDPCTNLWTSGSADYRVLAVLNDTQYGGLNTSLEAPGFSGSSMASASNWRSEIGTDYNISLYSTDGTTPIGTYEINLDAASTKYISNVFGKDPTVGDPDKQVAGQKIEAAYLYKFFENSLATVVDNKDKWYVAGSVLPDATFPGETLKFVDDYSLDLTNGDSGFSLTNSSTPWVISQKIAPWQTGSAATRFRMFKFHTLSDGTNTNTSVKVEISNVKLAGTVAGSDWGTFTVTVRKYSDTDKKPVILESFRNCNLDPTSANYVARRIGDSYRYIDFRGKILEFGTYSANSRHVRVEMNDNVLPVTAVPYGFEAYATPVNSAIGRWVPTMKYTKASLYSSNPGKYPSGITFDDAPTGADDELTSLYPTGSTGIGASDDNKQYFAPLPEFGAYDSNGGNVLFALDEVNTSWGVGNGSYLAASLSGSVPATYDSVNETTYVKMRKFVFGFQGGFDGQSPSIPINTGADISAGNTQGLNCTNSTSAGSIAYKQCIGALSNADEFDINLIVVPGIIHQYHSYVTNLTVDLCEQRGDCFFIIDLYADDGNPSAGQISEVTSYAAQFDTNYAAAYYPWVKILDTNINEIVTVPASVVMPAVYAANDKVAAPWFAPAGLNRGGISNAIGVTDRTTHSERDDLYEGKVNPIAIFPGEGVAVWGQKTLQDAASALDRVNVQRLMIQLKKYFASVSKYLLFENATASTRNKFLSIVNPYMESIKQRSGLYNFFVKMDEENNTADIIDENILYGKIFVQPTKTIEFIVLDFVITPTGAVFPTV